MQVMIPDLARYGMALALAAYANANSEVGRVRNFQSMAPCATKCHVPVCF